jgi:lactoylglutathione lyase
LGRAPGLTDNRDTNIASGELVAAAMSTHELRLVLTVDDFDHATAFFRDVLGLRQVAAWENDGGHAVLLDGGRATLEIFDQAQARAIDEIEVGRRVAGQVRVAFQTSDSESMANALARAGAEILGGPVITPWRDRNVRLLGPEGIQLTLFTPPDE